MITDEAKLRETLIEQFHKYENQVFLLNDFMAENPELGSQEYKSSEAIVGLLKEYGIKTEYPFAGLDTAFRGVINPGAKRRAALLAEYDALRGLGHACGHCASGSASVLLALAAKSVADQLDFGLDIIGTPDEEFTGCKEVIASQGYFSEYDFAVMVHMGSVSSVRSSFIALDGLGFRWKGQAAHAAANPWDGRNALNAARLFLEATDMMRQHIIPEARIHGFIKNGGQASNIVPDETEIEFLTRAPRRQELNDITSWVKDCAQAAALATRTELECFPIGLPFHELYVSESGSKLMLDCFKVLNLPVELEDKGMSGSSDIGNVDYYCPAFHPMMGIGISEGCHTKEFAVAMTTPKTHEAIHNSAALMAAMIAKLYTKPELLEAIRADHKAYRGY